MFSEKNHREVGNYTFKSPNYTVFMDNTHQNDGIYPLKKADDYSALEKTGRWNFLKRHKDMAIYEAVSKRDGSFFFIMLRMMIFPCLNCQIL